MAKRDVIVMGGSAGGIEACCEIIAGLPADLPATLFVVQHVGPSSHLAEVLGRCGEVEVRAASDRDDIKQGTAYVAPGDRHLLLED